MDTSKEIVGRMIKEIREYNKISQQQLADMLEVDRQYIWKIENGKVNLTMDYLDKVISKLNCSHAEYEIIKKDKK